MIYAQVAVMRDAGLAAKWAKRNGAPVLLVSNPSSNLEHQKQWWAFNRAMQKAMTSEGVAEGFDSHTLLADIFSIKV